MATRTIEERKALMEQVDELRKKGTTTTDACKQVGVVVSNYYNYKAAIKNSKSTAKKKKAAKKVQLPVERMDISIAPDDDHVFIIFGNSNKVNAALDRLAVITRG